jgi:hypothetical protein
MSCTNRFGRGDSSATESDEGIRGGDEFVEASPAEGVAVKKDAKEVDTFLTDSDIIREPNSFSLNVTEKVDMILAVEWGLSSYHFE